MWRFEPETNYDLKLSSNSLVPYEKTSDVYRLVIVLHGY